MVGFLKNKEIFKTISHLYTQLSIRNAEKSIHNFYKHIIFIFLKRPPHSLDLKNLLCICQVWLVSVTDRSKRFPHWLLFFNREVDVWSNLYTDYTTTTTF